MPLEIENNTKSPSIQVKGSITIELAAAIHYLSDRKHHEFPEKLANSLLNHLSLDSLKMLKIISGFRLQGLELFEFIIKERVFDDIELLIEKISQYDDENFIYTLLGEVLERSTIQHFMQDRQYLYQLMQEKPNLVNDNAVGFEMLFCNTSQFKWDVINLIKEMNNNIFHSKLSTLKEDFCRQIEKTKVKIKDKVPMAAAQEIMDRQFKKVYDFREYYFIPSYFLTPHKIRVYCCGAQMVVFALEPNQGSSNEIGDHISLVFKIISDRTRLEILRAIMAEPSYGKLLAERLNLTTATISHHIEVLKSIRLINEKRIKNIKYFEANEDEIRRLFDEGLEYLIGK